MSVYPLKPHQMLLMQPHHAHICTLQPGPNTCIKNMHQIPSSDTCINCMIWNISVLILSVGLPPYEIPSFPLRYCLLDFLVLPERRFSVANKSKSITTFPQVRLLRQPFPNPIVHKRNDSLKRPGPTQLTDEKDWARATLGEQQSRC